jgi:hypothetical protein
MAQSVVYELPGTLSTVSSARRFRRTYPISISDGLLAANGVCSRQCLVHPRAEACGMIALGVSRAHVFPAAVSLGIPCLYRPLRRRQRAPAWTIDRAEVCGNNTRACEGRVSAQRLFRVR